MRISDLLKAFASDLERQDNEALLLAEESDEAMSVVAEALVAAASILKKAAITVEEKGFDPKVDNTITPERLDEMAALAEAMDQSGDPILQKQANLLDEILLTIGAPKDTKSVLAANEETRIEELKKKYNDVKEQIHTQDKVSEALAALKKSEYYKQYRPLEVGLSTRYCPDHPGVPIQRIGEHEYQCEMDKKVYNSETGYKLLSGNLVPGTSVDQQTPSDTVPPHAAFDTRDSRLNNYFDR